MKILFDNTDLTDNENFREGLSTLIKAFGYDLMWTSAKSCQLFEFANVYKLKRPKVHTLQLNDKLIIVNGVDPLMYVDLSKRELHKYEDEANA